MTSLWGTKFDDRRPAVYRQVRQCDVPLCYRCHRAGHIARYCTKPRRCYRCYATGHLARDCYNERRCFRCYGSGHLARDCDRQRVCFRCLRPGHTAARCRFQGRCYKCHQQGHVLGNCPVVPDIKKDEISCCREVKTTARCFQLGQVEKCIEKKEKSIVKKENNRTRVIKNKEENRNTSENEILIGGISIGVGAKECVYGLVGDKRVKVFRQYLCSDIVVRRELIDDSKLTGEKCTVVLMNESRLKGEMAIVTINTPYVSGIIKVVCIPDIVYDVIVGKVV